MKSDDLLQIIPSMLNPKKGGWGTARSGGDRPFFLCIKTYRSYRRILLMSVLGWMNKSKKCVGVVSQHPREFVRISNPTFTNRLL